MKGQKRIALLLLGLLILFILLEKQLLAQNAKDAHRTRHTAQVRPPGGDAGAGNKNAEEDASTAVSDKPAEPQQQEPATENDGRNEHEEQTHQYRGREQQHHELAPTHKERRFHPVDGRSHRQEEIHHKKRAQRRHRQDDDADGEGEGEEHLNEKPSELSWERRLVDKEHATTDKEQQEESERQDASDENSRHPNPRHKHQKKSHAHHDTRHPGGIPPKRQGEEAEPTEEGSVSDENQNRRSRRGAKDAGSNLAEALPVSAEGGPLPFQLNINEFAEEKTTCPLPVLHPGLWQKKMGWGERKSFPRCGHKVSFSRIVGTDHKTAASESDSSGEGTGGGGDSGSAKLIIEDCKAASSEIAAYGFKEMLDKEFTRLTSTLDAEGRQNALKARYDISRIEDYGKELHLKKSAANKGHWEARLNPTMPYVMAICGKDHELHVRSQPLTVQHGKEGEKQRSKRSIGPRRKHKKGKQLKNILHVMVDSTSLPALRRDAKRMVSWLHGLNNAAGDSSPSYVYTFRHYHAVSCCSPGNQIPVYSGNMNGEGDHFVNAEPKKNSKDWLWNIASSLGFKTFWSLDNCPDKSARDYHAFPSVDERVVAPLCVAGVLLSHKDMTCLAGKTVDEHVVDGLSSFWERHQVDSKFAAVQFITPHEESEKLLIEVDILLERFFRRLEESGTLNDTAVFFWSDHGINFGKYASTHDGEIEKVFPFANLILPRWFAHQNPVFEKNLRHNMDMLTTPYDMYEIVRELLYFPQKPPRFAHDPSNPPLPKPHQSHIVASFQKKIVPVNLLREQLNETRNCWDANIPMEFCTCLPWKSTSSAAHRALVQRAVKQHQQLLAEESERCEKVTLDEVKLLEVQEWPTSYKPKEQTRAKEIWMKPDRDMVKVQYTTKKPGEGLFEAVFSVGKKDKKQVDLAHIDRLDAMQKKCGVVEKVTEQLCVCK